MILRYYDKCEIGYRIKNGKCNKCEDENCLNCGYTNEGECISCINGYFLINHKCISINETEKCYNNDKCLKCQKDNNDYCMLLNYLLIIFFLINLYE